MTSPDSNERPSAWIGRAVTMIVAGLVALFAIGVIAGLVGAAVEHEGPHNAVFYLILLVAVLVVAGAIWLIFRNRPVLSLPASPRMRKSRLILYACLLVGFITGMALVIVEGPEAIGHETMFAPNPISPVTALVLLLATIAATALSLRWHMLLDEHERAAYDFGAVASIYVYFLVSVGWWLLARGGLAPAPDGFAIFWLVMITWLIGWVVRRYR